ncbi:MAG: alpha/beta hydrolase [Actinomycetaceae bacterium]|nr:alpha/beta hydrolase [Actinomycetaceae bacterium]
MRYGKSVSVLAAVILTVSACSQSTSGPSGSATSSSAGASSSDLPAAPKGLEKFYSQDVDWGECEGSADECAEIEVPLDYDNPGGKTITVALRKHKAEGGEAIGSLFINPGGPGGSGMSMLDNVSVTFSRDVRKAYDIIGFDPRGVGKSTPVDCLDDEELGDYLDASYDMSDPAQVEQQEQDMQGFVDGCKEKSGDLLQFVGTEYAARDMDVMRQLVGDPKINYVGFSYGTSLGGTYADLFPKNVGRMILDGAVDDRVTWAQNAYDQTMGFENALTNYIQDCIDSGQCVLGGSVDEARQKVRELIDASLASPFPTSNSERPLTQAQLVIGILTPLYDDASWPILTTAFEQLINNNDGSLFQYFADAYSSRQGDKFTSNMLEANIAINCASRPASSEEEFAQVAQQLGQEAPVFGGDEAMGTPACNLWPYSPDKPKAHEAKGSDPIVVVGTRHDPATPYAWAEKLNDDLDNSVLVTWEGEGHTAYGRNSGQCVQNALDAYLLEGTVPKDGLTCPAG